MDFNHWIADAERRLFIIAEAGVNHNGNLETALELVDAAIAAGCDAVKFQTWITEKVYSQDKSIKPEYQVQTTHSAESEFETIKKLELDQVAFRRIKQYCDQRGILFFSTPDELESAGFLRELGVPFMKTASQDVTNPPFLRQLAQMGIPMIFSTGACTLSELCAGVEAIRAENPALVILHCVSSYPAPMEQINLSVIPVLSRMFGLPVGFSDHTQGMAAACAAVALGARVFEKHLTLDKTMQGPDHQASLDPEEMRAYCDTLRAVRSTLGDGCKRIMPCEENTRKAFRRYLVSARDLPAGTVLEIQDLCFKKVVDGIAPQYLDLVVGARLGRAIPTDTVISWQMLGH